MNVAGISTHQVNGYLWAALQRALTNPSKVFSEESRWGGTVGADLRFEGLVAKDAWGVDDLTPEAKEFAQALVATRSERAATGMLRPGEEEL